MMGFLVVDKPAGVTSHDVVAMVRAVTGIKKVGHTGTLDPFATGVLPLALGPATRLIQYLDESLKEYDGTITLGSATDTGDFTGEVVREAPMPTATREEVEAVLAGFLGDQMQEPPAYSAVKVGGKPLYHYARKGENVRAKPRPIKLHKLEVLAYGDGQLRIFIQCSRGTYARVLADDVATALGSAGHLLALSRPRSGPFTMKGALSMETLAGIVAPGHDDWKRVLRPQRGEERIKWRPRDEVRADLAPYLLSPLACLDYLPKKPLTDAEKRLVVTGAGCPPGPAGCAPGDRFVMVHSEQMVAIAESAPGRPKVLRVLPVGA